MNMFSFFHMDVITTRFFIFRLKLKWLKKGGVKDFIATYIFLRKTTFFIILTSYFQYSFHWIKI